MSDLVAILDQGAEAWNRWRAENPELRPLVQNASLAGRDLRGYDLRRTDFDRTYLTGANLSGCDCTGARFHDSFLEGAQVAGANLAAAFQKTRLNGVDFTAAQVAGADFAEAVLWNASFRGLDLSLMNFADADCWRAGFGKATLAGASFQRASCIQTTFTAARLMDADFTSAILHMADFDDADLTGARMMMAQLVLASAQRADLTRAELGLANIVNSNLSGATLVGTKIYGLSAWNVELEGATQEGLVITRESEPAITCDDVEIAQFIYLLLENAKVRKVIDTVTSKVVLILGNFSEERKPVLDALREELRKLDTTPILFDFEKPHNKDVLGTVETLARMARFIIVDVTDPRSVPFELGTVVPYLRNTPILPLLLEGGRGFSMLSDLWPYPWVMDTHLYRDQASLLASLPALIAPADALAAKLRSPTRS